MNRPRKIPILEELLERIHGCSLQQEVDAQCLVDLESVGFSWFADPPKRPRTRARLRPRAARHVPLGYGRASSTSPAERRADAAPKNSRAEISAAQPEQSAARGSEVERFRLQLHAVEALPEAQETKSDPKPRDLGSLAPVAGRTEHLVRGILAPQRTPWTAIKAWGVATAAFAAATFVAYGMAPNTVAPVGRLPPVRVASGLPASVHPPSQVIEVPPTASAEPGPALQTLAADQGRLKVSTPGEASVYLQGVARGSANSWLVVPCGTKHLRLASKQGPAQGVSFPRWISPGSPTTVRCGEANEVDGDQPPSAAAAESKLPHATNGLPAN